jgi:malonyl-CoA O-methyltransferase
LLPPADLLGIDKAAVASRFNRSARTYDDHCRVQRLMADRLMARLRGAPEPLRILELGCGTGYFTGLLAAAYPRAEIRALDFAGRMVEAARARVRNPLVQLEVADAETAGFPVGAYDLIVSNAAVQWFDDPAGTLAGLASALRPGGRMLHSTFGPATFRELREVLGEAEPPGLPLCSGEEWEAIAAAAGLSGTSHTSRRESVFYPGAASFLGELQATGATWRPAAADDRTLPPGRLRTALDRYDARFSSAEGVRVTYELVEVWGNLPGKTT